MNKNLLDRLVKKGSTNLLVKPIFNNFKMINSYYKIFGKYQKFLNPNDVFKILKINFNVEQPIGYTLINDKKEIVGFLGTFFLQFSRRKLVEHCYLHSWIVLKKYRIEAFNLILPLIKKNIFLSTYSPISSLEGLYKKLGF